MERLFRADRYFDPRDIASFDGRGWEGVVLDETTRDDLKKQFRTKGGSFVRPEATILTPAPGARWEIQALQDANNGKARITGFHVEFRDGGVRPEEVGGRDWGRPDEWYPRERYSDWCVLAWPRNGVALLVVREQGDRPASALVTTPGRLGRMLDDMERNPTRVEDLRRQFDRLSRTVAIGQVTVSLSRKDIRPRRSDRFEDDYRSRARRDIDRGDIAYSPGEGGSVYVDVEIYFRDGKDNNRVEVSAQLSGRNERGQISASGSGSRRLDRYEDRAYDDLESAIDRAYDEAIDEMLGQAARNIRNQSPPSPADQRRLAWYRLFEAATR
ncbi:MAG TPA: hypothetical protein VM490_26370 [Armatimonadaceae bacterium]|nr:hypothetical protein [Armatimonadaceae bacterium]